MQFFAKSMDLRLRKRLYTASNSQKFVIYLAVWNPMLFRFCLPPPEISISVAISDFPINWLCISVYILALFFTPAPLVAK